MAHSIVYGICENKCQVEVMSKEEIMRMYDALQEQFEEINNKCIVLTSQIKSLRDDVNKLKR